MGIINAFNRNKRFDAICKANRLHLQFHINESAFHVFEDIFVQREYADYFPFYQDAVIVDIGAHYGFFSLFADVNTGENARIFAVEPDGSNFIKLKENIHSQKSNKIQPENYAVANKSGEITLYKGSNINHSIEVSHGLLQNTSTFEKVKSISLDDLFNKHNLNHIDFLKMDCEGAEYEILLNASGETLNIINTISIEFHDLKSKEKNANALIKKLTSHQFKIVKFQYAPTNFGLNYGKLIGIKDN